MSDTRRKARGPAEGLRGKMYQNHCDFADESGVLVSKVKLEDS